ncbi:MAG: caspase family protein [Magnetococcales bacterium]|nr:caspase family protein [Magnetococcales bacterium]
MTMSGYIRIVTVFLVIMCSAHDSMAGPVDSGVQRLVSDSISRAVNRAIVNNINFMLRHAELKIDDELHNLSSVYIHADKTKIGLVFGDDARVWDFATGQHKPVSLSELSGWDKITPDAQGTYTIPLNDTLTAHVNAAGTLTLTGHQSKDELVKAVTLKQRGWATLDKTGRFDAPYSHMEKVSWMIENDKFNIKKFASSYYEPGLLVKYYKNSQKFLSNGQFSFATGVPMPPSIDDLAFISEPETADTPAQILVSSQAIGNTIEDIVLYHNGKKVPAHHRFIDKTDAKEDNNVRAVAFNVLPQAGNNEFKAIAVGYDHMEGNSKVITKELPGTTTGNLYALVVGVNEYKGKAFNLDYAVNDAEAIKKFFSSAQIKFKNIYTHHIYDHDATKSNIIQLMKDIGKKTTQSDVVVIYFAGHGVVSHEKWYFLSHDFNEASDKAVQNAGISASSLQEILLNEFRSNRMFIMFDACHSEEAIHGIEKFAQMKEQYLLSQNIGIGLLSGSRSNQKTAELPDLGHGLFTFAVLEALNGKAFSYKEKNKVFVSDVIAFAEKKVDEYSEKVLGMSQKPFGMLSGFDVFLAGY